MKTGGSSLGVGRSWRHHPFGWFRLAVVVWKRTLLTYLEPPFTLRSNRRLALVRSCGLRPFGRSHVTCPTMLVVQKYGGTSVADAHGIRHVAGRVLRRIRQGDQVIVVVSAMGNSTDDLIDLALQVAPDPDPRELDMLLSTGEQVSVALVAMAL